MRRNLTIAAGFLLVFAVSARAVVLYDEGVSGDLSNNQAAPTPAVLAVGSNTLSGTLRISSAADSQDWIAVTIPSGMALNSLTNTAYAGDPNMFTGFQNGSSFVGSTGTAGNYNGYTHLNLGTVSTDVLPGMGAAPGAVGFTPPLGPGTYTFLYQQTGAGATSYAMDFVATPEPASLGLLAMAGTLLIRRRTAR